MYIYIYRRCLQIILWTHSKSSSVGTAWKYFCRLNCSYPNDSHLYWECQYLDISIYSFRFLQILRVTNNRERYFCGSMGAICIHKCLSLISVWPKFMMTSSNGNIFCVTGPWYGEFTGHRWIPPQRPVTRSFDVFFDLRLNRRLGKQSRRWLFDTPWRLLWRHCWPNSLTCWCITVSLGDCLLISNIPIKMSFNWFLICGHWN